MLIIVVCLFVICWMPLQIYGVLSEIYEEINNYRYINIIWFCSNWLAMSNSCYNPFIYGLLNEKFKFEYRLLFARSRCLRSCAREQSGTERTMLSYRADTFIQKGHRGNNGYLSARYSPVSNNDRISADLTSQTLL